MTTNIKTSLKTKTRTKTRTNPLPPLAVLLAAPRGFCAGVERAVAIVEQTLRQHGKPVYVRHEIVHNAFVVQSLQRQGVVFVEELEDIPLHHRTTRPVVFSAHGVAKAVVAEARRHAMRVIDATCPLVSKVHREVERFYKDGYHTLLIGHRNHPEVAGTMGQQDFDKTTSPPRHLDRNDRGRRILHPRPPSARAHHPNDALARRHERDHRDASPTLSRNPPPEKRRHLLRHRKPPKRRESYRAALRFDARHRCTQLLELHALVGNRANPRRRRRPH